MPLIPTTYDPVLCDDPGYLDLLATRDGFCNVVGTFQVQSNSFGTYIVTRLHGVCDYSGLGTHIVVLLSGTSSRIFPGYIVLL